MQSCCSRTHHQAQGSSSPRLVMFVARARCSVAPRLAPVFENNDVPAVRVGTRMRIASVSRCRYGRLEDQPCSSSPRSVVIVADVASVQAPRAMFRKRIADVTRAHQAVTKCCRDAAKCTAKRCGNADAEFACAMSILSCCVTCMACPLGSRPRCTMDVATSVCALTRMSRALP